MNKSEDLNSRTLTIKKTFNVNVKLVWEAWTKPEHITNWWGPKGMEVKIVEHDFKVGGNWRYIMDMPNMGEVIAFVTYSVITELKKIFSSDNFIPMKEGVEIQALFEAEGDKTNFTFNCIHPTEEYCKQQEKMGFYNGWGSTFERLGTFLGTLNNK